MGTEEANPPKERVVNFGLLIQQKFTAKGIETNIESQNQGIADSDIILIVEAWLEVVKKNFKKNIQDGLVFGGQKK